MLLRTILSIYLSLPLTFAISSWPMLGFDASHTGGSASAGPPCAGPPADPTSTRPFNYDTYQWRAAVSTRAIGQSYPTFSTPIADGKGSLFVQSQAGLFAFSAKTGAPLWSAPSALSVISVRVPAVGPTGTVFAASFTRLLALNGATGAQLWNFSIDGNYFDSPIVSPIGAVFFTRGNGTMFALNGTTGAVLWLSDIGCSYSIPALSADGATLFVSGGDVKAAFGKVFAINASTGAKLWEYDASTRVDATPLVTASGSLVVGLMYQNSVVSLNATTGIPAVGV